MKRLHVMMGPIVFLAGSLGLAVFGSAVAASIRTVLAADTVTAAAVVAWLPAAVSSLAAVAVGFVLTGFVSTTAASRRTTASVLAAMAGVFLATGACLCVWSIGWADRGLALMFSEERETAPKVEEVDVVLRTAEPSRQIGAAFVWLAATLTLAAGVSEFREKSVAVEPTNDILSRAVLWAAVGSGVIVVLLMAHAWLRNSMLRGELSSRETMPAPREMIGHLQAILGSSRYALFSLGLLGLLKCASVLREWRRRS